MPATPKNQFAATVPIGVRQDVVTGASVATIVKQMTLTHPGQSKAPSVSGARAVCPGPNGSVFVAVGSAIVKISKDMVGGENVSLVAGFPGATGTTNGVGAIARFGSLIGGMVYHQGTDSLYVSDTNNSKIRKIDLTTNTVSDFAGSGTAGVGNGNGTAAQFNLPQAIATDGTNLFVGQGAFSTAVSLKKIVIANPQTVTNCATTQVANTTTHIEGVSVDMNNAYVWYTTRDNASTVTLRRYRIANDDSALVLSNGGSIAAAYANSFTAYGGSDYNIATSGAQNIFTVVCDADDDRVAYVLSRNAAMIRRVKLVEGTVLAPTAVQVSGWCGHAPPVVAVSEGIGNGASLGDNSCLSSVSTSSGVLYVADASDGSIWAVDSKTSRLSYLIDGEGALSGIIDPCDATSAFTLSVGTSVNGNVYATGGALKAQSYGTATNGNYKGPDATLPLGASVGDFMATFAVAWTDTNVAEMGRFAIDFRDASNNVLFSYSVQDGSSSIVAASPDMYNGTGAVTLAGNTGGQGAGSTTNTFDGNITITRTGSTVGWSGGGLTTGSATFTATAITNIRFRFEAYGISGSPSPFTLLELKDVNVQAANLSGSSYLMGGNSAGNHDVLVHVGVRKNADGTNAKDDQILAHAVRVPVSGLPVYIEEVRVLEPGDDLFVLALNGPVRVDVNTLEVT